ncbi:MAG: hypothetical protein PVI11_08735 [Candidatus Aminicenantes bacterium]|jgi:hypothetical protein
MMIIRGFLSKKTISLVLVFSILLVCHGESFATNRRGAEVLLQKKDGQEIKGELLVVQENALILLESISGEEVSVKAADIRVIQIEEKAKPMKWALYGFFGVGIPVMINVAVYNKKFDRCAVTCGSLWAAIGAVIGTIFAFIFGTNRKYRLEEKSQNQIQKILEKLQANARVSNIQ